MTLKTRHRPQSAHITRPTLAQNLTQQLRDQIMNGDLAPGQRLQEADLSRKFGVSRTPLREALKSLASEGLISISPNKGATVTKLTEAEIAETFPVMGALEALAGELACAHASPGEIRLLRELHEEILAHYHDGKLQRYFATNQRFHENLVTAAHNATLAEHYHQLAGRVLRARYRANLTDAQWAQSVAEHDQIIVALEARDSAALASILRAHIDHKFETVRATLETDGDTAQLPPKAKKSARSI